jgi:hypothetical protein
MTAASVPAEMLTVPGHARCSCEQEIVMGGSFRTGYVSAIAWLMLHATIVSVIRGRYGPCCSKLPMGKIATVAPWALSSSVVAVGSRFGVIA